MREIFDFDVSSIVPEPAEVLGAMGYPSGVEPAAATASAVRQALDSFAHRAAPSSARMDLSPGEFARVYEGSAEQESETPIGGIYRRARRLALFAVTVGQEPCRRIARAVGRGDYALAAALDAVAALAAERAAGAMERRWEGALRARGELPPGDVVLGYPSGWCGWGVTGREALFEALAPEDAGITLEDRILIQPWCSLAGVLVSGPLEVHEFEPSYPFCIPCPDRRCRERLRHARARAG